MLELHQALLTADAREASSLWRRSQVAAKLLFYALQRPLLNHLLKLRLVSGLQAETVFQQTDCFLWNEGGMFKEYIYQLCQRFGKLQGAKILVPGVGWGRNLFQLARFRPAEIVAFDLYAYPDEWRYLQTELQNRFGVKCTFLQGDFDKVPSEQRESFDFIISEAVLEHVRDLKSFGRFSYDFLKSGGIFYASYGPIWYGPSGDHVHWGQDKIFDHLLLAEAEYQAQFEMRFQASRTDFDSCEGKDMIKEDLFSHLKAQEYLVLLQEAGFKKEKLYSKIYSEALETLARRPELNQRLNAKAVPAFDRFCGGFYLWLRK